MSDSDHALLNTWFSGSLGQALLTEEKQRCNELVPSRYYPSCLQIGMPMANFLQEVETRSRFLVETRREDSQFRNSSDTQDRDQMLYRSVALGSALPFAEKTHDLIILPHTLDFCSSPHEVLRQVSQILTPEGCVVITGFNLLSFYGLIRTFKHRSGKAPWNGQYYSVGRVQDWLSLLGFDLVGAGMTAYQPPFQTEQWRNKLAFLDRAGDRWWPGLGGVYMIVGRKKEMAIRPSAHRVGRWRQLLPGIAAQPAAQRAAKSSLRLVVNNESV